VSQVVDAVAALVPPLVVAGAFLALGRAVIRHTDGSRGSAEVDRETRAPGTEPGGDSDGTASEGPAPDRS
jgi:hypothetical protein